MDQVICKGILTQTIYVEGEEAAVHQFLNTKYPSYSQGTKDKPTLNDPLFPEPLSIWKVRDNHEKQSN